MPQGLAPHGRNHTSKKPIRSFNTTKTGRGGDQSGRYHANAGWETIEAAHARAHIDPAQAIEKRLSSLRERFYATLDKTLTVDSQKTKAKIKQVRGLIERFSGDKTGFLQELTSVEQSFSSSK